jgi:hypothetical protein
MTRQINVLNCQPDVLFMALLHIENKLAQESLQEFYGRQPMDPAATLMLLLPTMDMGRVIVRYLRIRSEPEILLVQRMKIRHHIFPDTTTIRLSNVWHGPLADPKQAT